jgi:hypothetical protein
MDFERDGGFKHFSIICKRVFEYFIGKVSFWKSRFKIELIKETAKLLKKKSKIYFYSTYYDF